MIDQNTLKNILYYDHETGIFTWRVSVANHIKEGGVAGTKKHDSYITIRFRGIGYLAHRLAFIWMTGSCPKEVDHINQKKDDNRWVNLREATASQNMCNRPSLEGSSSKYKGVTWHKRDLKWMVNVRVEGKKIYIGYFDDEESAAIAYDAAATKYHGEFANLNFGG